MIHRSFIPLRRRVSRRRARAGPVGPFLLGLALLAPGGALHAEEDPIRRDSCAPVEANGGALPDLQQGAWALCHHLFGDAEPGPLADRLTLRIGGWADGSYQDVDLGGVGPSVALNHANLRLDARLDDTWQVFFEGEYEHEPNFFGTDEREWEVEQLYGEYRHSDALHLRAGRFGTPFGYWTPVHWSILVDTIEEPIHEANRIVPEQQIGLRAFGRVFTGEALGVESDVAYSLHGGYAAEGWDPGKPDGWTFGSDLSVGLADTARLGASLYTQENGEEDDRREDDLAVYGEAQLPFGLFTRFEYVRQWRSGRTRPVFVRNADIVYAKLRWDFHRTAYLNYRFEYGEDDRLGFTSDHTVHRFTLGWRPIPRVVLKSEYARHVYTGAMGPHYHFWGASAGVFF